MVRLPFHHFRAHNRHGKNPSSKKIVEALQVYKDKDDDSREGASGSGDLL